MTDIIKAAAAGVLVWAYVMVTPFLAVSPDWAGAWVFGGVGGLASFVLTWLILSVEVR